MVARALASVSEVEDAARVAVFEAHLAWRCGSLLRSTTLSSFRTELWIAVPLGW